MTPAKRALLRDTLCARLPMEERPEALLACAMAVGIDLPALWHIHGLSEDAHPHSKDAGRPWVGDGSDYSDLPDTGRAGLKAMAEAKEGRG